MFGMQRHEHVATRDAEPDAQASLVIKGALLAAIILAVGTMLLLGAKNKAEGFSQAYLDEQAVPAAAAAGAPFQVSFAVENFEGRSALYGYSVRDAGGRVLASGSAILEDKEKRLFREPVTLEKTGQGKVFVFVTVDGSRQLSLFFPVRVG